MTSNEGYQETDEEVVDVAAGALAFIVENDELGEPYDLRGLCVYGVIGMLRENDERFYGEKPEIDEAARARVDLVVDRVNEAVALDRQYFPFAHKRSDKDLEPDGVTRRRLAMIRQDGSIPLVKPKRMRIG